MTTSSDHRQRLGGAEVVTRARSQTLLQTRALGWEELADDAALVSSELLTNALLHGGGFADFSVSEIPDGIRIAVRDHNRIPPMLAHQSRDSLTGRGMHIVRALAARWGVEAVPEGKIVWAELTRAGSSEALDEIDDPLAGYPDLDDSGPEQRYRIELGDVPTDLLLAAKSHVDSLVREFALASAGAQSGRTADVPEHLASLLQTVVDRFADARLAVKHQALEADRRGAQTTRLTLDLPASAAAAAEEYLAALDEVDFYCRAMRLLTLETPPQHAVFRRWYIGELAAQLRSATLGLDPVPVEPFERRLLRELDALSSAQRSSERAARLYSVASALAAADTPEAVASAVLTDGAAALGASGGGILLATDRDNLTLPGAVGYDEAVMERLRSESRDAELPAAVALRTGEAVWLESREDAARRFPELMTLEAATVSLCAVPLEVQGRRLGALRFSFAAARLFDDDERLFIEALAAQTAQALDRAQLQRSRIDISRRLQRSLLPPRLPAIPGLDVAAMYHPFGDGMDVGGDFYDVWQIAADQWAIAIGDSAGTGPEAAGMTALVRHTLRALAMVARDPVEIVRQLNTGLVEATTDSGEDRFCTAIFGIITQQGGEYEVELAGGGHPPVFVRRHRGDITELVVGGWLLGVFADAEVGHATLTLRRGDTAMFLTDGVIEARREGAMFDTAGVHGVLAGDVTAAQVAVDRLEGAVVAHTAGSLTDDMAAVVLHVPSG